MKAFFSHPAWKAVLLILVVILLIISVSSVSTTIRLTDNENAISDLVSSALEGTVFSLDTYLQTGSQEYFYAAASHLNTFGLLYFYPSYENGYLWINQVCGQMFSEPEAVQKRGEELLELLKRLKDDPSDPLIYREISFLSRAIDGK